MSLGNPKVHNSAFLVEFYEIFEPSKFHEDLLEMGKAYGHIQIQMDDQPFTKQNGKYQKFVAEFKRCKTTYTLEYLKLTNKVLCDYAP